MNVNTVVTGLPVGRILGEQELKQQKKQLVPSKEWALEQENKLQLEQTHKAWQRYCRISYPKSIMQQKGFEIVLVTAAVNRKPDM